MGRDHVISRLKVEQTNSEKDQIGGKRNRITVDRRIRAKQQQKPHKHRVYLWPLCRDTGAYAVHAPSFDEEEGAMPGRHVDCTP